MGCVTALVLAAWYPEHVRRVVLVNPRYTLEGDSVEARALRECPPDWDAIRKVTSAVEARSADEFVATLP